MRQYDDEFDFEQYEQKKKRKKNTDWSRLIPVGVVLVIVAVILLVLLFTNKKDNKNDNGKGTEQSTATEIQEDTEILEAMGEVAGKVNDPEDPQNDNEGAMSMSSENGASVDVAELLLAGDVAETEDMTYGIDVSKYQGTIDWRQVAASGIDFAIVRVGYRVWKNGEIIEDSNARYNMQEAQANGIKLGAYFFSSAVTAEEAIEEADWVADCIAQYQITYPVAYNCEGFENPESRQYNLSKAERTDVAMAFLNRIYERGYTPMFYAAKNELESEAKWDTSRLEKTCKIWMAWYSGYLDPMDEGARDEIGNSAMWQYSNQGSVPGIPTVVDVNVAYFGYEGIADAKSDEMPETVAADAEALMNFSEVSETVTAKEKTNLRDIPSQGEDSTVLATLSNGETATRTGVSSSGWSRVEYNGAIYYAVSNYLTTDLTYKPPVAEGAGSGDGIKTKFMETNDLVTAKIEVNLRALPSVTNPDATVVATLHNGETVTRTGINEEYGWSRVDYNGQTLYCISSYLTAAQ